MLAGKATVAALEVNPLVQRSEACQAINTMESQPRAQEVCHVLTVAHTPAVNVRVTSPCQGLRTQDLGTTFAVGPLGQLLNPLTLSFPYRTPGTPPLTHLCALALEQL